MCHTLLRVETADLALGRQSRTPEDLEDRLVTTARVRLGGTALGIALTHLDHRSETLRQKQARMVVGAARAAGESWTVERRDSKALFWTRRVHTESNRNAA